MRIRDELYVELSKALAEHLRWQSACSPVDSRADLTGDDFSWMAGQCMDFMYGEPEEPVPVQR